MSGKEKATPAEIRAFARSLTRGQAICRSYGHAPRPSTAHIITQEGSTKKYYEQSMKCLNGCGVVWHVVYEKTTGTQLYRNLDYSRSLGYLATGIGRLGSDGRALVRLETIKQYFTKESE